VTDRTEFLKLRASRGDSLCPNDHTIHHTIHRNDDTTEMWVTCGTDEIGRLTLEWTSCDRSDEIRHFIVAVKAAHDSRVAGDVVLELLAAVEETDAEVAQ
jgi:hypothetical protein